MQGWHGGGGALPSSQGMWWLGLQARYCGPRPCMVSMSTQLHWASRRNVPTKCHCEMSTQLRWASLGPLAASQGTRWLRGFQAAQRGPGHRRLDMSPLGESYECLGWGSMCTTNGGIVCTQCVVAIDMHNDKYLFNAPKRIEYTTQCTATSGNYHSPRARGRSMRRHLILAHLFTAFFAFYLECVVGMSLMLLALRSSGAPHNGPLSSGLYCPWVPLWRGIHRDVLHPPHPSATLHSSLDTLPGMRVGCGWLQAIDMNNDNHLSTRLRRASRPPALSHCT